MMQVSILLTAYRETAILPQSVQCLIREMERTTQSFEIIVCDDGSADDTPAVIAGMKDDRVRCVTGAHLGKGGSLARGVAAACGEYIFYTDADLAYGTRVIHRFLRVLRESGADVVIGSRLLHPRGYSAYPAVRQVLSRLYRGALYCLGGLRATDPQCGCKAYRADAAKMLFLKLTETGFAFEFETLLRADRAGYTVRELPVCVQRNGCSHVRPLRDGISMLAAAHRIKKQYFSK